MNTRVNPANPCSGARYQDWRCGAAPFLVLAMFLALIACGGEEGERCANGVVCPPGMTCAAAQATCIADSCGNGSVEGTEGEQCDDGNINDGDGCSSTCALETSCGDGVVSPENGEVCDDGNAVDGDGCSSTCMPESVCGDGTAEPPLEQCDDGNTTDGDGCSSTCMLEPVCGDGVVTPENGEECDDGNTMDGDGCSSTCTLEPVCGDGVVTPGIGEECDDGNTMDGDGCSSICTLEFVCGNGVLEPPFEQCDDGNTMDGDGCSSTCTLECIGGVGFLEHTLVLDTVQIPTTAANASMLALDIDGAQPIRTDNTLGMVLATLSSQVGLDVAVANDDAVARGEVITLANLAAFDLQDSACAEFSLYAGRNPSNPPCTGPTDMVCGGHLDGMTSFDVLPPAPTDSPIPGVILGGGFGAGAMDPPGTVTISLQFSANSAPTTLQLVGARAQFTSSAGPLLQNGILGGALTDNEVATALLPGLHSAIADVVAMDCAGGAMCCTAGSTGETLVNLFDEDGDCEVSLSEFADDPLVSSLLAPDLDLFDANGNDAPNTDGVPDTLSFGVGFTAIGAQFQVP